MPLLFAKIIKEKKTCKCCQSNHAYQVDGERNNGVVFNPVHLGHLSGEWWPACHLIAQMF